MQAAYIFAYMSYYAYFHNYLHLFQSAALFTEGVGQVKRFTIPVTPEMLILLLDLPIFIKLAVNYDKTAQLCRSLKKAAAVSGYTVLAVVVLAEFWNYSHGISLMQLGRSFYSSEQKIIERYGTFVNNIVDVTVNYGGQNMINQFKYGETVTAASETDKGSDIVVIQVEAMGAPIIDEKYKDGYVTPFLHSVAQQGIYYPYTLSYHKSGGTSDCEFSVINSVEPLGNYPSIKIPKYDYPNSFVKTLESSNYSTMAFHGNIGNYYNRDVAFSKMGFDVFYDMGGMKLEEKGWGIPDHEVFDFALEKMREQRGKPFLSYIITMSSHMPFKNTASYYSTDKFDAVKDENVKNYYTVMSYVDKCVQDFVTKVKAEFPGAYILIFGDHSPGITSDIYTQAAYMAGGDYFEYVPFILLTPDNKQHQENKYAATFLDISPTILYAAGVGFTIRTDGINLADPPRTMPQIPFKGKLYDRDYLFAAIDKHVRGAK